MTKHRNHKTQKRATRPTGISRRRRVRGGSTADREQSTDFVFFKPAVNASSGYTHYIIYNNLPIYLYGMDLFGYQLEEIEGELRGYSENRPPTTSYKYRLKVNSDHARTESQRNAENAALQKKIDKLEAKQKDLKAQIKGDIKSEKSEDTDKDK